MPLSKVSIFLFFFNVNAHMPLSRKVTSPESEGRRCATPKMRGTQFSGVPEVLFLHLEVPFFFLMPHTFWKSRNDGKGQTAQLSRSSFFLFLFIQKFFTSFSVSIYMTTHTFQNLFCFTKLSRKDHALSREWQVAMVVSIICKNSKNNQSVCKSKNNQCEVVLPCPMQPR